MSCNAWPRWILGVLALLGAGCTSLREVPRAEYAALPERRHVRLVTLDSLIYEFDHISVSGDSLVGYRRLDVGGPVEEFSTLVVPLAEVSSLSARSLDWYRTGLLGGGVLAAIVARGLVDSNQPTAGDGGSGGGGGRTGP